MNRSSRPQLWLATLGAVASLTAGGIPATIQLLDEDPPATAVAPVENVAAPAVAPAAATTTTAAEPTAGGQGGRENGRGGRRDRGGGGGEP